MTAEQFLSVADSLPEPTLLLEADGRILAGNQALGDRLGIEPQTVRGRTLAELVADPPEVVAAYLRRCSRSRRLVLGGTRTRDTSRKGVACRLEGSLLLPRAAATSGKALLLVRLLPRDAATKPFPALSARVDELAKEIRQRKRLEAESRRQEEQLRLVADNAPVLLAHCDAEGRYIFVNAAYAQLFGRSPAEVIGKQIPEIVGERTHAMIASPVAEALRGNPVEFELEMAGSTGGPQILRAAYTPHRDPAGNVKGLVAAIVDITDRRRSELALRESLEHSANILESITDAFITLDRDWRLTFLNGRAEEIMRPLREAGENFLGRNIWEALPDLVGTPVEANYRRSMTERVMVGFDFLFTPLNRWFEIRAYPSRDGISVHFQDISARKLGEQLESSQKQVLELIAQDAPLPAIFDRLVRMVEEQAFEEMIASILLLDEAGLHLRHGASPSLPVAFREAIDGVAIGPKVGSCGTAAYLRKPVHVSDIASDPLWEDYAELAAAHGLRACWSTPIVASQGELLGTFAMYYREARAPSAYDLRLVELATRTAAIAIERQRAREALRKSDERFRNLADNIPQLAWIADVHTDGQVNWFNRGWYDYTGTTPEEMRGLGWRSVHHPDYVDRVVAKFQHHVRHGLDWEDTFPLRGKDGNYRWFLSRMTVIRDEAGAVTQLFGTNTDITERRQLEDDLRKLAAQLAETDRRKDEFLATLAHELRNPLAPIRNGLQVIRQAGNRPETLERAQRIMERQISQTVRLVDDLMDVSRITRGKIELRKERIQLADAIDSAVETSRPVIEELGQELSVQLPEQPIFLEADLTRLAQVFMNLLTNAAKYSERGGRIELSATLEGPNVVVAVRDNGIGISPAHLPIIFQMFAQADRALDKARGGLGIGLTLVERLVELHGGRVEARSEGEGMGSEFVVWLPASTEAVRPDPDRTTAVIAAGGGLRILVVDDNRDSADCLEMMLELMGHEVHAAYDGRQGVELAGQLRPDVVLLDIGLPGLDGFEACRRIRSEPWGERAVLIAVTGWGQDEDRRRSREAGFDHHLVKPLDQQDLARLIAGLEPAAPQGSRPPAPSGPR